MLKRPKMRFLAPKAPFFFCWGGDPEIIKNSPLLITDLQQGGGVNKNCTDYRLSVSLSTTCETTEKFSQHSDQNQHSVESRTQVNCNLGKVPIRQWRKCDFKIVTVSNLQSEKYSSVLNQVHFSPLDSSATSDTTYFQRYLRFSRSRSDPKQGNVAHCKLRIPPSIGSMSFSEGFTVSKKPSGSN